MYTEKQQKMAMALFMANPHWKEYYETAPSDLCKEYIKLSFCFSHSGHDEDATKRKKEIKETMSPEDWKHLYQYCGNNPFKVTGRDKIRELGGTVS